MMAMDWKAKTSLLIFLHYCVSTIDSLADDIFCEWGVCESWEYCCGDNVCCSTSNGIAGNILLGCSVVLAVLLICLIIFLLCKNGAYVKQLLLMRRSQVSYTNFDTESSCTTAQLPRSEEYVTKVAASNDR